MHDCVLICHGSSKGSRGGTGGAGAGGTASSMLLLLLLIKLSPALPRAEMLRTVQCITRMWFSVEHKQHCAKASDWVRVTRATVAQQIDHACQQVVAQPIVDGRVSDTYQRSVHTYVSSRVFLFFLGPQHCSKFATRSQSGVLCLSHDTLAALIIVLGCVCT